MELPYSKRSSFFGPIAQAIGSASNELGRPLHVALPPGGYDRDVHVTIRADDPHLFQTDWVSRQPSRFSARIRAAATVLQRGGLSGRFRIAHHDGTLTIQRA